MATVDHSSGNCLTCFQPPGPDCLIVLSAENYSLEEALLSHFWFTNADLLLATICKSCRDQVNSFHRFYVSVKALYHSQTAIVKPEPEPDGYLQKCSGFYLESQQLENINSCYENENTVESEEAVVECNSSRLFVSNVLPSVSKWSVAEDELDQNILLSSITKSEPVISENDSVLESLPKSQLNVEGGQLKHEYDGINEPAEEVVERNNDASLPVQSNDGQGGLSIATPEEPSVLERSFKQSNVENVEMYQNLRLVLPDCMDVSDRSDNNAEDTSDSEYTPIPKTSRIDESLIVAMDTNDCVEEGVLDCPSDNSDEESVPLKKLIKNRFAKSRNRSSKKPDVEIDRSKKDDCTEKPYAKTVEQTGDLSDNEPEGFEAKRKTNKERKADDEYINKHVKYHCEQCGNISPNFSAFRLHALHFHENKAPFVMCCGKKYFNKYSLLQHVQVLNDPDKFRCKECGKYFRNKEGYTHHYKNVHSNEKPAFKCARCPKVYNRRFRLKVHMDEHAIWDKQTWKCTQCDKVFSNGQSLSAHILKCWSEASNCDICRLVLPSKTALEAHNLEAHGGNTLPSRGPARKPMVDVPKKAGLGSSAVVTANTAETVVEQHDSEQSDDEQADESIQIKASTKAQRDHDDDFIRTHVKYICEECGEESQTFFQFKEHSRQAHNNSSPFLLCCGKKFFEKYLLFGHVQLINNPNAFRCETCLKNFNSQDALRRHVKMYHTGNTFRCDRCPKTFATDFLLREHMDYHANRDCQRWKCETCLKIYQSGKSLTQHIRRLHPEWPEYTCDVCLRKFRLTALFEQHKQTHQKRQCSLCSQMLPDANSFRVHARLLHPHAIVCSYCMLIFPTMDALQAHKVQDHSGKLTTNRSQDMDDSDREGEALSVDTAGSEYFTLASNENESERPAVEMVKYVEDSSEYSDDEQEGLVSLIVKSETEVGGVEEGQPECSYTTSNLEVEQQGSSSLVIQNVDAEQSDDLEELLSASIKTKRQFQKDEKAVSDTIQVKICLNNRRRLYNHMIN